MSGRANTGTLSLYPDGLHVVGRLCMHCRPLRMHWPKVRRLQWAGHFLSFGLTCGFAAAFWPRTVSLTSQNDLQYGKEDCDCRQDGCHIDDHVNFVVFFICSMVGWQVSVYLACRASTWHLLAAAGYAMFNAVQATRSGMELLSSWSLDHPHPKPKP